MNWVIYLSLFSVSGAILVTFSITSPRVRILPRAFSIMLSPGSDDFLCPPWIRVGIGAEVGAGVRVVEVRVRLKHGRLYLGILAGLDARIW